MARPIGKGLFWLLNLCTALSHERGTLGDAGLRGILTTSGVSKCGCSSPCLWCPRIRGFAGLCLVFCTYHHGFAALEFVPLIESMEVEPFNGNEDLKPQPISASLPAPVVLNNMLPQGYARYSSRIQVRCLEKAGFFKFRSVLECRWQRPVFKPCYMGSSVHMGTM